jgi:hypothetical protein
MKRAFALMAIFLFIAACDTTQIEQQNNKAIDAVQHSRSIAAGAETLPYMTGLFGVSRSSGNNVVIKGWEAAPELSRDWGGNIYNVFFHATENGKDLTFHWIIDKDNIIHPANDVAKGVTPQQQSPIKIF